MYQSTLPPGIKPELLPKPAGYKLLIAIPEVKNKTSGGILIPDSSTSVEKTASILAYVVKTGPDAYSDPDKFPNGPYCKEGDWIIMHSYSGTRFRQGDVDYRLINDDTVEAVVEDPSLYRRA